ncbi:protein starmaker-like isoform X2 [Clinocottus analis]|uniref:protein starmaker-like isoform X2 n=1 Tax=Clinocottus analis TaxID=304258 RepID=UPI0035C1CF53
MDRYEDLDLDCEEGGVAQKAALFGGMFKKSTKSSEQLLQAQDSLSVSSELSKSRDSLTDSSTKEKGGLFKGVFKKTPKTSKDGQPEGSLSIQNPELSVSSDNLTDKSSTEKSGVFGGRLKRSPKLGHARRPSQDLLDTEFTASNDSLTENKEKGGMFSGMFKKSPKPFGARTRSQEDLLAPSELSGSKDNLSVNSNTKETGGMFSGMFKKSPKPSGARTQSQEDLSAPSELSGSKDNLSVNSNTKETGGMFSGMFKKSPKPFGARTQSQDGLSEPGELSGSNDNLNENTKEKGGIFGGVFKKKGAKFQSQDDLSVDKELSASSDSLTEKPSKEKSSDSDSDSIMENGESQPSHKQSRFSEAMEKMNPFRSANKHEKQMSSGDEDPPASSEKQKDTEDIETLKETEKQREEKLKSVKGNIIQRDRKDRSETPVVPSRPTEEEMERTSTYNKVEAREAVHNQDNKDMISRSARPSEEGQPADRGLKDESSEAKERVKAKVKKHKRHNPFMPNAAAKAQSDDEGLEEDVEESSSHVEKKDEEGKDKPPTTVKKPKRHNPFMPRNKRNNAQDGAAGNTTEGGKRTLFDQLEDLRIDPLHPKDEQDVENLMEWWNNVESWEDTPQEEDMTEKEEAKAFAVTADKVQKGIRVFNKLFTERAESLWQHVIDLNGIADALDKFNKNTKIAQITGGSTSAIGGVATITGLALAPVTMGVSLIVTAVGLGVATAGGLTSAGAGISNQVNNSMDRKKVEKIVQDYQEQMVDLNKCLKFIKQGIENLKKFDLIKMKKHAYNRDFPVLSSSFYEDGAMAGKAILVNANEIMRVVQIANVAGSTAARAVQIASMATGVLTGLFVGMDIYFVAKDSKELKKGAKSEFAAKIREVATQLHDGLVELNGIREELQTTAPASGAGGNPAALTEDGKEKKDKCDSSSEDEIDRIKKAIKKDYENREYV